MGRVYNFLGTFFLLSASQKNKDSWLLIRTPSAAGVHNWNNLDVWLNKNALVKLLIFTHVIGMFFRILIIRSIWIKSVCQGPEEMAYLLRTLKAFPNQGSIPTPIYVKLTTCCISSLKGYSTFFLASKGTCVHVVQTLRKTSVIFI